MTTITELAKVARATIAALTPAYEPAIRFKEAPKHQPLRDLEHNRSGPFDNTRQFQLTPDRFPRVDPDWSTPDCEAYFNQGLNIAIRYQIPEADNGFYRREEMVAEDVAQILHTLLYRTAWPDDSITVASDIENVFPDLEELDGGIFLLTFTPRVNYPRDAP